MDIKWIRRLVRLMDTGGLNELEIEDEKNGLRVRMRRGATAPEAPAPVLFPISGAAPPPAPAAAPLAPGAPAGAGGETAGAAADETAGLHPITSPLVGTFYRSPAPDADPFVEIGSRVEPGDVVCIIEAMKVMNEIKAEVSGEVVQILVENGEPVEFGQPLLLVRKG